MVGGAEKLGSIAVSDAKNCMPRYVDPALHKIRDKGNHKMHTNKI